MSGTMAEKVWRDHIVSKGENGAPDLLYIDLHLVHEVTSPQAFEGLRLAGRQVRRPDLTIATEDHNTPTVNIDQPIADITSRTQIDTLRKNAEEFGIRLHSLGDADQGIVHVVGPQLGLTQPGMTIVCGDSHTSTHGAFGALAFGIGTSQVEHVLATPDAADGPLQDHGDHRQRFPPRGLDGQGHHPRRHRQDRHRRRPGLRPGVPRPGHPRALHGGPHAICNMSIEAGARAGMIAPDQTTFDYIKGRPHAPEGEDWDRAVEYWSSLASDEDAVFDAEVVLEAADIEPFVTWGTNPVRVFR